MTAPTTLKTMISAIVHAQRDLGNSLDKVLVLETSLSIISPAENIPRVTHFRNEARQGNLADKRIANIQKGRHSLDKGGARYGHSRDDGLTLCRRISSWFALDTRKGRGQDDTDQGEEGRGSAQLRHHTECPRERRQPANHNNDNRELDGAASTNGRLFRHCVEILCANKDMQCLNKGVVEDKHDGGSPPGPFLAPKQRLAKIANIANLGVAETKLPQDQTRVQYNGGDDNRQDQTGYEAQVAVRPGKTHDGKADVLAEEEGRRFLPGAGAVLDCGAIFGGKLSVENGLAGLALGFGDFLLKVVGEVADARANSDAITAKDGGQFGGATFAEFKVPGTGDGAGTDFV